MSLRALDEFAVLEDRAVADEGDEVGCSDRAPAFLGGLDEFEHHGQAAAGTTAGRSRDVMVIGLVGGV